MIDIDYNWSFTDMAMNYKIMVNYEKNIGWGYTSPKKYSGKKHK